MKKTICLLVGLFAGFSMIHAAERGKPGENKEPRLYLKSYVAKDEGYAARTGTNNYQYRYDRHSHYQWADGVGGSGSYGDRFEASDNDMSRLHDEQRQMGSPASDYPPAEGLLTNVSHAMSSGTASDSWATNESVWAVVVAKEHCVVRARVGYQLGWPTVTYGSWVGSSMDPLATGKYWRKADAKMMLETGGRARSKQKNLFCLSATAEERTNILSTPSYWNGNEVVWSDANTRPIASPSIKVDGKALGSDGKLWRAYADNRTIDVTPKVRGKDYYSFTVDAPKHHFVHFTVSPALADTNLARTKLGVGEYVNFGFVPALGAVEWPDVIWAATSGGVATSEAGTVMQFTAPSNAANVTVSVTVKGQTIKEKFKVLEPAETYYAETVWTNTSFPLGQASSEMHLRPFVYPATVSFYRVEIMEIGQPATAITGYFTSNAPPAHDSAAGANVWIPLQADNSWHPDWDYAGFGYGFFTQPWSEGSFKWEVPAVWKIKEGGPTNTMAGWLQTCRIETNGTVTVRKFIYNSATRGTNGVYTDVR